jgi:hypothetical protein
MKLKMYIGDQLVASVPLQPGKIKKPGFIQDLVNNLKEQHQHEIKNHPKKVVFFIDNVPSSMNYK